MNAKADQIEDDEILFEMMMSSTGYRLLRKCRRFIHSENAAILHL
jgi:hypothetical protein